MSRPSTLPLLNSTAPQLYRYSLSTLPLLFQLTTQGGSRIIRSPHPPCIIYRFFCKADVNCVVTGLAFESACRGCQDVELLSWLCEHVELVYCLFLLVRVGVSMLHMCLDSRYLG